VDPQEEQCPVADELPGQHEGVLDYLVGQVANTGGDLADQGNGHVGGALGRDVHRVRQILDLKADSLPPGLMAPGRACRLALSRDHP
jgi:hypothetical protein